MIACKKPKRNYNETTTDLTSYLGKALDEWLENVRMVIIRCTFGFYCFFCKQVCVHQQITEPPVEKTQRSSPDE